jgi:transcriptional regulator with XRE-family HTH domain
MKIDDNSPDQAILNELGSRLARHRLNRNLTQAALADQAGVSLPTLARLERGRSTSVANLIRVLRSLRLAGNLEALIPEPPSSPIQQLKTKRRERRRASSPEDPAAPRTVWTWGDDQ